MEGLKENKSLKKGDKAKEHRESVTSYQEIIRTKPVFSFGLR